MLFWSAFFNYLCRGTPFDSWKNVGVLALWSCCLATEVTFSGLALTTVMGLVSIFYFTWTIELGTSLAHAAYCIFLINTWYPVWRLLNNQPLILTFIKEKYWLWVALFPLSALGMLLDTNTSLFQFLSADRLLYDELDVGNSPKRAVFFFIASTAIAPFLAVMTGVLSLSRNKHNALTAITIAGSLIVIGICSGSLSTLLLLIALATVVIISLGESGKITQLSRWILLPISALIITLASIFLFSQFSMVEKVFTRATENVDANSESNILREKIRTEALDIIHDSSITEHLIGHGLGSTIDTAVATDRSLYPHGESSLLQTYLETGLIGTLFMLAPFIYLFVKVWQHNEINWRVQGMAITLVFLLTNLAAPNYLGIAIQFFLGLAMGVGSSKAIAQYEKVV